MKDLETVKKKKVSFRGERIVKRKHTSKFAFKVFLILAVITPSGSNEN